MDWGVIHNEGAFEEVSPEIETFLGPEMGTSVASAIWAQKNREIPSEFITNPSTPPSPILTEQFGN